MEFSPSAPPPSYDDVMGNSSQQNYKNPSEIEVQSQQQQHLSTNYYNPGTTVPPYQQPINHQTQINQNFLVQPQQSTQTNGNVIIIHGGPLNFGHFPTRLVCPVCHQSTLTTVKRNSSWLTHSVALFFCCTGLGFLFCLPYCMSSCKNTSHYCRKCGNYLGTHRFGT